MKKYHIYGLGSALIDTEITLTDADLQRLNVEKGIMTLVDEARQADIVKYLHDHDVPAKRASGGSAANTIIAASYFGSNTFYSCRVADDDNGQYYLNDLREAGVQYDDTRTWPAGITGKCLVMVTPDAERSMNTFLGINETLSVDDLQLAAVADSEYVYWESYLVSSDTGRAAAIALRNEARAQGTKVAMSLSDPAMVQFFRDGLIEMIGDGVDLLFCNEDEALGFTQTDNLAAAEQALLQYTQQYVITRGAEGAIAFDGNTQHHIMGTPVTAVDTNGAGDMFAGAFLHAISQGQTFDKAGQLANRAAAQVVSQFGPRLRADQYPPIIASD